MKTRFILLLIFSIFIYFDSYSQQIPESFKYQGVARNGGDIINGNIGLRISLKQGSASGSIQYQETHSTVTNPHGVFSIQIGNGSPSQGSFNSINWGSGSIFLQVELDPFGGTNYTNLGTSQVLSVPYAIYAEKAKALDGPLIVDDADADPTNEIQQLTKTGTTISLSQGGGTIQDFFEDADANPSNELQTLSSSGSLITLSQGGGTVNVEDDDWILSSSSVYRSGSVGIGMTTSPSRRLTVRTDILSETSTGSDRALISTTTANAGFFEVMGANENSNFRVSNVSGNANHGSFGLYNSVESSRLLGLILSDGQGYLSTIGPNGQDNVRLTTLSGNPNNGFLALLNSSGNTEAGLFINSSGQGELFADVKNFRIPHPEKSDKNIWYACLEGPEAAAYERGTIDVINGEAFIPYSEHFRLVINPNSVTVNLTPLTTETYGLAVIEKTAEGIKVKELMEGNGNFQVDWEVKGVRKGHENYEVIRDANHSLPTTSERSPSDKN